MKPIDPGTIVGLVSLVFYAGGYVVLTKNHLKHLSDDIKRILHMQKRTSKRISRLERRIYRGE